MYSAPNGPEAFNEKDIAVLPEYESLHNLEESIITSTRFWQFINTNDLRWWWLESFILSSLYQIASSKFSRSGNPERLSSNHFPVAFGVFRNNIFRFFKGRKLSSDSPPSIIHRSRRFDASNSSLSRLLFCTRIFMTLGRPKIFKHLMPRQHEILMSSIIGHPKIRFWIIWLSA